MKSTMSSLFLTCMGLLLLAGIGGGCSGGKTERKKMLHFNSPGPDGETPLAGQATGEADFPFYTSDVDVQAGGTTSGFLLVAMPDPAYDSLAMNMLVSHAPFAVPLLSEWASQEKKGVLIDLRSSAGNDNRRADYIIERANAFSIPVVFLWDRYSAARATAFIQVMQSFPAVHCRCTGGSYNSGRQDCFPSASPGIDGR